MKTLAAKNDKLNCGKYYWTVISAVAFSCGTAALAQADGVTATNSLPNGGSTNVTDLGNVTVIGQLNQARNQIVPSLGASAYTINKSQIESASQGGNAPFSQIILRAPGVAEDSAPNGGLHVRGEHANLQYRINDVLLPEGVTGFGQELDPRFVDSMQLITGSLPAQYGFRTAGVVDIQTKSGAFENGGSGEVYGGSYNTYRPSFEYGGADGKLNYFFDGSYDHNDLGIENPTASHNAIHDITGQYRGFTYLSYVLDDTSRISVMGSADYSDFQIPNTPGLDPGAPGATTSNPSPNPWWTAMPGQSATSFNSANLNENQNEQNYYGIIAYQKSAGDLNLQVSTFVRNSDVHFTPDPVGDLYYNGVASDVQRNLYSGGLQADARYELDDKHTLRGGAMLMSESTSVDTSTTAFNLDPVSGNPTSLTNIVDNSNIKAMFAGVYLQDEWKLLPKVTLNYGARFDVYNSSFDNENQLSPRVNLIYQPTDATTLHAGYSRYFTPPPAESVSAGSLTKFAGTSNQSATDLDTNVKSERANYYDVGVSQKLLPGWQAGLDGYYKTAQNQLDDGLFGQSLIPAAFNYSVGRIYGVEFTTSYEHHGFSVYANVAYSKAQGKGWNSSQFLFDPTDAAYVQNHWISLDHDQRYTGSFGVAYTWKEGDTGRTRVFMDALYGSGLRTDGTADDGSNIPNGASVPAYYSINVGIEQGFNLPHKRMLKARLDVVNLTDNVYQLRNGSGVGVNASQYGERLGFFGSLSYAF